MKRYRKILALMIPVVIFMLSSCKSTYLGRYVKYFIPDVEEPKEFPSTTISKAPLAYNFIDATEENKLNGLKILMWGKEYNGTLEDYLKMSKTNSFVVIRNDSILYEKYFNGYTRESLNYSFSVTKSVTSMPLFVALDKGYINSLDDKIIKYLPELDSSKFSAISIRDLIDMHSGIKHNHSDLPWGDEAKHYYKPNVRKYILKKLKIESPPGQEFKYVDFNPLLVALIIERVTGQSLSAFFEKNIWEKIGTEHNAKWTLDGKKSKLEKTESGFSATAIDFARLAGVMIDGTNMKGEQIISQKWIKDTYTTDTSVVPISGYGKYNLDWGMYYNNLWWPFYDKETKETTALLANGLYWQFLYINPEKKLVIVRMGDEGDGYDPDNFKLFKNIAKLSQ